VYKIECLRAKENGNWTAKTCKILLFIVRLLIIQNKSPNKTNNAELGVTKITEIVKNKFHAMSLYLPYLLSGFK